MLPPKHRMVEAEEFSSTLRKGVRKGNRFLVVAIAVPPVGTAIVVPKMGIEPKVGFIVAKKQLPRAVDRNRIKRRLRHIMADRLSILPDSARVVIRVLAPSLKLNQPELVSQVDRALAGLGCLVTGPSGKRNSL